MSNNKPSLIPNSLRNASTGFPYVTESVDIYDGVKKKSQQQVNADTDETLAQHQEDINAEKQRAEGIESGLDGRIETLEGLAEISVGGGDIQIATGADFDSPDATKRAKAVTVGAMLDGMINSPVFDLSAYTGDSYASLDAALAVMNAAGFPSQLKKGGMTLKFVQSSDNKYVQYRLMSQIFSNDAEDWAVFVDTTEIENPEYVDAKIDAEGKLLEGIKSNGTKYLPGDLQVVGNILNPQIENMQEELSGLSEEASGTLSYFETSQSQEWLQVTVDSEKRVLGGRKKDGTLVENMPIENPTIDEIGKRAERKWEGLTAITLGDSHSERRNEWMPIVCDKLGLIYLKDLNNELNVGNITPPAYEMYINALTAQVATLIDKKSQAIPDVIFVENVHFTFIDNKNAFPFKPTQLIDIGTYNMTDVEETEYFEENFDSIIGAIPVGERKVRTVVKSIIKTTQVTVTFSAATISEGVLTLTINNNDFPVEVSSGESLSQVIGDLMQWQFEDYVDWKNVSSTSNSITFQYIGSDDSYTFDASVSGNTGISITNGNIIESTKSKYRYFRSNDLSDWDVHNKWLRCWNWIQGYMFLKGIMELLQENFPNSIIVVLGIPNWSISEQIEDYYEFINSAEYLEKKELKEKYLEVGSMYNCKTIDIEKLSGISAINYFNYYVANNVHPKPNGYKRWANVIVDNIN